jgi:hypothetical protein
MRNVHRAAVLWLSFSSVLFGAGCLLSQEQTQNAENEAGEAADPIGGFSSSLFQFTVLVSDDGKGRGGGWQVATATLKFRDFEYITAPKAWECRITVGMPIRSTTHGIILPGNAATVSAARATFASSIVRSQADWPIKELFCRAFAEEMERGLKLYEPGATVTKS